MRECIEDHHRRKRIAAKKQAAANRGPDGVLGHLRGHCFEMCSPLPQLRHLPEPFRHRHLSFDAWKSACQSTRPRGTAAVLLVVVVLRLTLQAFLLPLKFSQHRPFALPR